LLVFPHKNESYLGKLTEDVEQRSSDGQST
jgi:hypothetical protein